MDWCYISLSFLSSFSSSSCLCALRSGKFLWLLSPILLLSSSNHILNFCEPFLVLWFFPFFCFLFLFCECNTSTKVSEVLIMTFRFTHCLCYLYLPRTAVTFAHRGPSLVWWLFSLVACLHVQMKDKTDAYRQLARLLSMVPGLVYSAGLTPSREGWLEFCIEGDS